MVGELDRGRTVRSLAYLLSKFERVKMYFVSPAELQMKADILEHLDQHKIWYAQETELDRVIGSVDVVYVTQIRPGPMPVPDQRGLKKYFMDASVLQKLKPNAMIMHPLPRTLELDKAVDDDPRAFYFQQATNGLFVRMALLTMVLD
jgi:aspartate carbamoyltransferase catalytic subunit